MEINDVLLVSALINNKFDKLKVEFGAIRVKPSNCIQKIDEYLEYKNSWIGQIDGLEVRTLAGRVNMADPDSLTKLTILFNICIEFINNWRIQHPHKIMKAYDVLNHFGYDVFDRKL